MKHFQKILSVVVSMMLLAGQFAPLARAFEAPTPPAAPTAPPVPTEPTAAPTAAPAPTAPTAPTVEELMADPTPTPTESSEQNSVEDQYSDPNNSSGSQTGAESATGNETVNTESSQSSDGSGNVGDTTINTGNADTNGLLDTAANNNIASGVSSDAAPSIQIGNTDNGEGSTNTGSADLTNTNTTIQNNTSTIVSGMGLSATTGTNEASRNVGDSTITTGDANVSGTLITNTNSNVDALMVSEFNIVDDHIGDIILDFAANCISGCDTGGLALTNSGNGADSTNTTNLDTNSTNETFQTNDATVENAMVLNANTGDNEADKNTGGDSDITTGDANINANMLTFANNNIAGDVIYGIVNIYGSLVGDIIIPEELLSSCCNSTADLTNTGNGSGSTNTTNYTLADTNETFQTNDATIDNTLLLDVNSGNNAASNNTGGDSSIDTGDTSIDANVLTVANTNLDGGNWWLVLVNEAGQWIGHILGADGDAPFAGSTGTQFAVAPDGAISVTNDGNGTDSTNTGDVTQTNTNTTVQNNTANVSNVMDLRANTGGNSTSKNTGGNNSITTGDATVIANIVNFVNNNIVGNGRLLVTVVNVFGSWLGNLVTPGAHQDEAPVQEQAATAGIGGTNATSGGSSQSNSNSDSSGGSLNQATIENTIGATGGSSVTYAAGNASFGNAMVLASTVTNPETGSDSQVAGRQVIHINLAWLILLLPCAIILFAIRRMRKIKTQLP